MTRSVSGDCYENRVGSGGLSLILLRSFTTKDTKERKEKTALRALRVLRGEFEAGPSRGRSPEDFLTPWLTRTVSIDCVTRSPKVKVAPWAADCSAPEGPTPRLVSSTVGPYATVLGGWVWAGRGTASRAPAQLDTFAHQPPRRAHERWLLDDPLRRYADQTLHRRPSP